jgi:hypothetical protein
VEPVEAEPHRLEVRVAGEPVRVWSDDVVLADRVEAWATAFCLPAARAGATLVLPTEPDPSWVEGAGTNVALAARWWGGSTELAVEAGGAAVGDGGGRRRRRAGGGRSWARLFAGPGTALCFTGGVDSFFSLLRGDHHPTHLLFVLGFDVDLDDAWRVARTEASVREVARELDLAPIVVRTDLRHHPRFAEVSWEHTHGAALAAVGHLLSTAIATLVVPPSYHADRLVPWGSRPDLDPGWSVPRRLAVVHGDASGRRLDRVLAIADHPLVHRHLRVCWQNVPGELNCGRCEKCVRTMAMLAIADALDAVETLPARADLPGAIDGLPPLPAGIVPLWQDLLDAGLLADERGAVERLLARSDPDRDPA